jgi:hypothetical protein
MSYFSEVQLTLTAVYSQIFQVVVIHEVLQAELCTYFSFIIFLLSIQQYLPPWLDHFGKDKRK